MMTGRIRIACVARERGMILFYSDGAEEITVERIAMQESLISTVSIALEERCYVLCPHHSFLEDPTASFTYNGSRYPNLSPLLCTYLCSREFLERNSGLLHAKYTPIISLKWNVLLGLPRSVIMRSLRLSVPRVCAVLRGPLSKLCTISLFSCALLPMVHNHFSLPNQLREIPGRTGVPNP